MDENEFAIGKIEAEKCIINAYIHQKFQASLSSRMDYID